MKGKKIKNAYINNKNKNIKIIKISIEYIKLKLVYLLKTKFNMEL